MDVVISDWMMPGVDGPELCRRVRERERNGRSRRGSDTYTYFIFLTALGDREHLLQGLEVGADDYLCKAARPDELQVRLISAAAGHRAPPAARLPERGAREAEPAALRAVPPGPADLAGQPAAPWARTSRSCRGGRAATATATPSCSATSTSSRPTTTVTATSPATRCSSGWRRPFRAGSGEGDSAYRYGGEEFLIVLPEQTGGPGARGRRPPASLRGGPRHTARGEGSTRAW